MPPNRVAALSRRPGATLLVLRAFLGVVFCDAGISKIADSRFLDGHSPTSMAQSLAVARVISPIGGLLRPVQQHSFAFGVVMAVAELAVGLGLLLGLLTRIAAAGGMLLSLILWLTVSWDAEPWFTSADLVYLFALTPLVIGGAGAVSLDTWLTRLDARERAQVTTGHRAPASDATRRGLFALAAAMLAAVILATATAFRRTPRTGGRELDPVGSLGSANPGSANPGSAAGSSAGPVLTATAKVPVGGAVKVRDPRLEHDIWVLQLHAGAFTALDSTCPHQGCPVRFVSASTGFVCPCHGSRFHADGALISGPATRGLTSIQVSAVNGEIRAG